MLSSVENIGSRYRNLEHLCQKVVCLHRKSKKFTTKTSTGSTKLRYKYSVPSIPWHAIALLLSFAIAAAINPPVANRNLTDPSHLISDHCVVMLNDIETLKPIGSVWISADNPCAIHVCETNNSGLAHVIITEEDCGEFYCDVDSELRPQIGTCCGACIRTKCRFNDSIYEIGQTWHNKNDCMLLECTQLPGGQPIINAYKKTCPPMPRDCAPENIFVEDCCQYCKSSRNNGFGLEDDDDIWTEEFYRNHPCVRDCKANDPPRTCHYTFVVEWYETLSKACYDCPQNVTDCMRPHCIIGDGIPRTVTVVNRMMPGPAIEVCENDIIVVDVRNELLGESTTMHWHGLHQRETPYMDGVPHISQCPISPHATFRYTFKADNPGTHFWHSHTGMQRGDGVFGALIIRQPRSADPHAHLYDFDLSEHKMLLQDWVHVPGISMFASHHHSRGDNKPRNLLINGRGRYYSAIWEMMKKEAKLNMAESVHRETTTFRTTTVSKEPTEEAVQTTPPQIDLSSDVDFLHSLDNVDRIKMRQKESNEISRLARLAQSAESAEVNVNITRVAAQLNEDAHHQNKNGDMLDLNQTAIFHPRKKRSANHSIPLDLIPLQVYKVRKGYRYRFRVINAEFLNCPIVVSVDNHSLTAISSDGYDFEPVEAGCIVTYAGERFDLIVNADQAIGNYWVRLKGLMDCSEKFTSAFQVAILRYEGASETEPTAELGYHHKAEGIELNTMNRGPGYVDSLTIAELTAHRQYDTVPGVERDALKPVADYKFFVYYDFYGKDNPTFHHTNYYGFNASLSDANLNRLFTPQLNHISLKFPTMALLPDRNKIDDSMFCNETSLAAQGIDCRKQFCKCHHVLQVPLNSIVELIIVDEGFTYDANHPFHLHGNAFRVVGLERLGTNVTIEMVKQLDRYNLLKRNLVRPPIKDTVTIPDGGYTIVRFKAYNPGFWLFHCHIEFHAEIGMALVLKVGDNNEMQSVPKGFPTCHDYMPSNSDESGEENSSGTGGTTSTTAQSDKNNAKTPCVCFGMLISITILLILRSS